MPTLRPRSVAVSGNGRASHFPFAQVAIRLRQLTNGREHQPDREIRDLFGQDVGRVGDDDAAPPRLGGIHGVVADAEIGVGGSQPGQPVHVAGVHIGVAAGRHAPDAGSDLAGKRLLICGFRRAMHLVKCCSVRRRRRRIIGPVIAISMSFTTCPIAPRPDF